MWNEMKAKWINKEAKVWFMEAQKWTQHDPGGYRWPPTYSNWLKTIFWQFTIFSSFSVPKLLGPF
jgi:hypothetical protein